MISTLTPTSKPVLIAACGNVMAGDDAFGPMVVDLLRANAPDGADIVNLDIRPVALLDHLQDRRGLLILDAVHLHGSRQGELVDLDWLAPNRPVLANDDVLSTHGLSIGAQLELAQCLGLLPAQVRLIGVCIEPASVGRLPGDQIRRSAPVAARRALLYAMLWQQ